MQTLGYHSLSFLPLFNNNDNVLFIFELGIVQLKGAISNDK